MASVITDAVRETTQPERNSRVVRGPVSPQKSYHSTDDEILGLTTSATKRVSDEPIASETDESGELDAFREPTPDEVAENADEKAEAAESTETGALDAILEGNAELRSAWNDAKAYREVFESPEKAREAGALLSDLGRMDELFFSKRASDHARLAESIADLDPDAFASLAKSMANEADRREKNGNGTGSAHSVNRETAQLNKSSGWRSEESTEKSSQEAFLQTTNAATVQAVVDAIETQVERLLPEGASKTTKNRVTGEIYRELDAALRDNKQLAQQLREAFRSGSLNASHQRAIVTLISGRARQALPKVAKKVMDEWTVTALAANRDRRDRQRTAEQRIDIAGSGGAGNDARHGRSSRDIDYARLSDADILNL
jgi:hypothetical protein